MTRQRRTSELGEANLLGKQLTQLTAKKNNILFVKLCFNTVVLAKAFWFYIILELYSLCFERVAAGVCKCLGFPVVGNSIRSVLKVGTHYTYKRVKAP